MDYIRISQNLRTFLEADFLSHYPVNGKIINLCRSRIDHFLSVSEGSTPYEQLFSAPERTLVLNANVLINDALRANQFAITQLETVKKAPTKEQKTAQVTAQKAIEVATAKISEAVKAIETATRTLETIADKISHSRKSRPEEKTVSVKESGYSTSHSPSSKAKNVETSGASARESQDKTAKKSKETSDKILRKKAKVRKEVATEVETTEKKARKKKKA